MNKLNVAELEGNNLIQPFDNCRLNTTLMNKIRLMVAIYEIQIVLSTAESKYS